MNKRKPHGCSNCKLKSEAVKALNEEEVALLEKGCNEQHFQKKEKIIREGSVSYALFYLKEGLVKLHKKGPANHDQILTISKPGAFLNIQSLFGNKKHPYSATALDDVTVCAIDTEVFLQLAFKNGYFCSEIISYLCQEELNYFERFINLTQKHLNGRLADALLYFAEEIYRSDQFTLLLTRTELAELIGATRESVARSLKEFADDGIIRLEGKRIGILNHNLLKTISAKG